MKVVHKFRLETDDRVNSLMLRRGFKILRSEYVLTEKAVFLWIEVPLDVSAPNTEVHLRVFRTGSPIPKSYDYVTTAIDSFGPEAYHLYRRKSEEATLAASA